MEKTKKVVLTEEVKFQHNQKNQYPKFEKNFQSLFMKDIVNERYLITLRFEKGNKLLEVDRLTIPQLLEKEFQLFKKDINSNESRIKVFKKYKGFHYLLGEFNYCKNISTSYQGVENLNWYKGGRVLLTLSIDRITELILERIKAYRIEKAYLEAEKLIKNKKILAFSHRRIGWNSEPFELGKGFVIQFLTNFGYGYVSYFYLVIEFENLLIIPYSDWVIYYNSSLYEILRYTKKYELKNESWIETMNDCKSLYNLSISDKNLFIQKHIINEAKKMVEGLKNIMKYNTFHLLDLNKDEITIKKEGYKVIEYRAEKVSGALKFIGHLRKFDMIKGILKIINEIEILNKELLPILENEYQLLSKRIMEEEPELDRLKPIIKQLSPRNKEITNKHNQIVSQLHETLKDDYYNLDRTEEIRTQLSKVYPNWKEEQHEFLKKLNKHNLLKLEIDKLKLSKEAIGKYLGVVKEYFKENQ